MSLFVVGSAWVYLLIVGFDCRSMFVFVSTPPPVVTVSLTWAMDWRDRRLLYLNPLKMVKLCCIQKAGQEKRFQKFLTIEKQKFRGVDLRKAWTFSCEKFLNLKYIKRLSGKIDISSTINGIYVTVYMYKQDSIYNQMCSKKIKQCSFCEYFSCAFLSLCLCCIENHIPNTHIWSYHVSL